MPFSRWAAGLRGRKPRRGGASSSPAAAHELQLGLVRLEDRRVLDAAGVLVADVNAGAAGSAPTGFTQFNGAVYFSAEGTNSAGQSIGRELFELKSDGQVSLVADIKTGSESSDPQGFTVFNNSLYFAASGVGGRELYRLDANGAVSRVADINPGAAGSDPAGFTAFDGNLYFAATASQGRELYQMNAGQQVQLTENIAFGAFSSNPEGFTEFSGKLYFAATGFGGREVYVLNRGGNVNQISDINPSILSSNPAEFTVFDNALYFSASNLFGRSLYRQSASGVNPVRVLDFDVYNPTNLTAFGDRLYFSAESWFGGSELYSLDAQRNVRQIETADGHSLQAPSVMTEFNGTLYFAATVHGERSLYRLDLTGSRPTAVRIALPEGARLTSDNPPEFQEFAGQLYFTASGAVGRELYRVDASDHVELVTDLYPGGTGSNPTQFTVFAHQFYFSADGPGVGRELFRLAFAPTSIAIVNGELQLTDVDGDRDNRIVVSTDGAFLTIRDENGHDIFGSIAGMTGAGTSEVVIPLASLVGVRRFVADTRGGNDSLTWNASQQAATLAAQFQAVRFDGGSNSPLGEDVLQVVGDGALTAVYSPGDAAGRGEVRLSLGALATSIEFVRVEPLDITGMDRAVFMVAAESAGPDGILLFEGLDALDSSHGAMVLRGLSDGVFFSPAHFFGNRVVEIQTGGNDSGGDVITILDVGSQHGNASLRVFGDVTPEGDVDQVFVVGRLGLTGDFQVTSGDVSIGAAVAVGAGAEISATGSVSFLGGSSLVSSSSAAVRIVADSDEQGAESIEMLAGARIVSQGGTITMLAGGDIQLAEVRTTADAVLKSRTGVISDLADNGAVDLVAASASLTAAEGVGTRDNPLETQLGELQATSGGGAWLSNTGDLVLNGVKAAGAVTVVNSGDVRIAALLQSAGPMLLDVSGALDVHSTVQSSGGSITLDASGDISLSGSARIDAQQGAAGVSFDSGGAIRMADGSVVEARSGALTLSAAYDVVLSEVRTTAAATVHSLQGAILDLADNGAVDLVAASAELLAALGIGARDNPLESQLGALQATSGGGLWLTNTGDLVLNGVKAAGAVTIVNAGDLRVAALLQSAGPMLLDVSGALDIQSTVQSSGGSISLDAGGDISLSGLARIDAQQGAAGVSLDSGGAIRMADGSVVEARSGALTLSAAYDVVLSEVRTTAAATVHSLQGAILDLADNGAVDLVASSAELKAALGIGAGDNLLETRIGALAATSGGGLWMANTGALVLNGIDAGGAVTIVNAGDMRVAAQLQSAGALLLDVAGALAIPSTIQSSGGSITLDASGDITLASTARVDVQSGGAATALASGGAVLMADGSVIEARSGALSVTAVNEILLSEVRTTAAATLHSLYGAILDLADSGAVDLVAATADLKSALGVGTADNPLEIQVDALAAATGGGLWALNLGALRILGVDAVGDVALWGTQGINVLGAITSLGAAGLTIQTQANLVVEAALTTSRGSIALYSANDLTIGETVLRSESGEIRLIADNDANGQGTLRLDAQVYSSAAGVFLSSAGTLGRVNGSLQGPGGLVILGPGVLELTESSQNTYLGATEVRAGVLIVNGLIGAEGAAGRVTIFAGAMLTGNGNVFAPVFSTAETAWIVSAGNLQLGDGSSSGLDFAGRFLIGAGHTVVVRDADLAEFGVSTSLGDGATLIVSNGMLVPQLGALLGSGRIDGAVTIDTAGAALPGVIAGILETGAFTLAPGSYFGLDVNGVIAGLSHDQVRVNGAVILQGARLALSTIPFNAANGTVLVLINNDGADPIQGLFVGANGAALGEGAEIQLGGLQATLSYKGGAGGNDVTLTLGRQVFYVVPITPGVVGQPGDQGERTVVVFYAAPTLSAGLAFGSETIVLPAAIEALAANRSDSNVVRLAEGEEQLQRIDQHFRLYFRIYSDALEQEGEREYDLPPDALGDLTALFRRHRFPNGHYRVYLQEFGAKQERLILDVQVYNGRVVTEPLQEDEAESQLQAPPADEGAIPPQETPVDQDHSGDSETDPRGAATGAVDRQSASIPASTMLLMSALRRSRRQGDRAAESSPRGGSYRGRFRLRRPLDVN